MAQSLEPETGTGVKPFWPIGAVNPPLEWEKWINQFFMISDLKEKCSTRTLLNPPDAVVPEPAPAPELPRTGESDPDRAARESRNMANILKNQALNEEMKRKGPKLAHNIYYHEAENNVRARLYLSLGTEGKKKFHQKHVNLKIHETPFRELLAHMKTLFDKEKNITYERFLLFTLTQKKSQKISDFHAVLSEQAAKCNLGALETEFVKDLCIARMNDKELQKKFCKENTKTEDLLKEIEPSTPFRAPRQHRS